MPPASQAVAPRKRQAAAEETNSPASKKLKRGKELRVTVGIDFGTTLTCIAFSVCQVAYEKTGKISMKELDKAENLVRFNSSSEQQSKKLYENVCCFDKDEFYIGDEAVEHADHLQLAANPQTTKNPLLRFLKLGICEDINLSRLADRDSTGMGHTAMREHLKKIREACHANDMYDNTYELVAKFIRILWDKYAYRDIKDTYRHTYPDVVNSKVDIVVTRPSIWTFIEDQRLIRAIKKATSRVTIENIAVFDEAHACLTGMISDPDIASNLSSGTVVLVLDIGGGTADLASIEIKSLKRPLCLRDADVPPSGGVFGATIVVMFFEQAIQKLVKPIYEENIASSTARIISWTRICQELVKKFEARMKDYQGVEAGASSEGIGMRLMCPDIMLHPDANLAEKGYVLENGFLAIKHSELQRLFKLCISGIANLTLTQIHTTRAKLKEKQGKAKDIKGLFVVGGFSKNGYLRRVLTKRLADVLSKDQIWFPPKFEKSAVAIGAMKYARNRSLLHERILQASVGFKQSLEWKYQEVGDPPPHFHVEMSPFHRNEEVLSDAVRWIFMKNDPVEQTCERTFRGTRYLLPLNGSPIKIEEDVFCSPVRSKQEHYSEDYEATYAPLDSPGARVSCVGPLHFIIVHPNRYPWFKRISRTNDGEPYAEVDYEIEVRWSGLRLYWTLTIPASGHFDCAESDCPGANDVTKCPGFGKEDLVQEAKCNLGAAFGDEQANGGDANAKSRDAILDEVIGPADEVGFRGQIADEDRDYSEK